MTLATDRDWPVGSLLSRTFPLVSTPVDLARSVTDAVSPSTSNGSTLVVEVYRPRLSGPVPQAEDVVAVATRKLTDIDVTDERSLSAAVRDAVAAAQPVARNAR